MLSIIIVNYNTKDMLQQCLFALYYGPRSIPFETILVDNGSRDGSTSMVRKDFPEVHIIENKENVGFASANNLGLGIARGDYILLLNSDTRVIGDALVKLVSFLDHHPNVGVVSGRLVYPDFSDQGVARTFPKPFNALFGRTTLLNRLFPNNRYSRKYLVSRQQKSDKPFEVDWVSGACLLVRKRVIDEVGFLDQKFFMYWEDADLCFRIKQKGWKVFCVPEALIIHYEGKSSHSRKSSRLIIEFNKSVYHYYRKHHIRHVFDFMNFVAILGLSLRTLLLLGMNMIRSNDNRHTSKDVPASSVNSKHF
jgi:GT2 family glycosyltransferase